MSQKYKFVCCYVFRYEHKSIFEFSKFFSNPWCRRIIDPFNYTKIIFESNMRLFTIFRHLLPHFQRQVCFRINVWGNSCIFHIKILLYNYNYEIIDDIMSLKWGQTVLNGRVSNILYKFKINAFINV